MSTRDSSTRHELPTRKHWRSSRTIRRFVKITSCSRKSMIERAPLKKSRSVLAVLAPALTLAVLVSACGTTYFEIPIETPIQAKLDVSAFQRVLIAGFVAGGTDDVDANQETVRLLRSQLRSKSELKVIDSDVMELAEIAR